VAPQKDNAGESAPSFEQAMAELERIVRQLEEGNIPLNEAVDLYEKGVTLLRRCHELLERAERRIELLSGVDAEGRPITTPLDDESLSLEQKSQRRSERRSARSGEGRQPPSSDVD